MLEYHEDREGNDGHHLNLLVEWKNMNKTPLWVIFFALSLSNLTPIIYWLIAKTLLKLGTRFIEVRGSIQAFTVDLLLHFHFYWFLFI